MQHILCLDTLARHQRGAEGSLRRRSSILVALSAVMLLTVGIAGAAEHRSPDARNTHTITVIDRGLLLPGAVTIGNGEQIEFANYSSEAIELVFIESRDRLDDVRCRLTGNRAATAGSDPIERWPLLASDPAHHPTVTIPPGRYTTACSFTPGQYAFVTKRVGRDARSPVDGLGQKGTIIVE
jgi:hypothetical protein